MTTIISISDLVESVRGAREMLAAQAYYVKGKREDFERSIAPESDLLREFKEQVEESERQLRAAVVAHWLATGEKIDHPAVGIRQPKPVTHCEYMRTDALKYALEHGVALKLDEGIFEAYMQALPEPSRPAWFRVVTETPEPVATIARELAAPEPKDEP